MNYLKTKNYKLKTNKGFTVIELMVAVGLFIIVVGIASGTFVQSLRTQRNVAGLMAANDNASLTLEQMTREIRTGKNFSSTGSRLSFINYQNELVSYALIEGAIHRNGAPLTSKNVLVSHLSFILMGEAPGDGTQTRVTILLGVSARGRLESFITRLQTTISPRILDE